MRLFTYTKPSMIVADEGKLIRDKNDIYIPASIDEMGNPIVEKYPHYSTTIFVPDNFTEEQMNELYIEENIEDAIIEPISK